MDSIATHTSIECVDDANGFPGVIVYDNQMYPLPSQQAGAGQGLRSSVRPFQFPRYDNEDNAVDEDSLETDGDSLTSHKKKHESKTGRVKRDTGRSGRSLSGRDVRQPTVGTTPDTIQ